MDIGCGVVVAVLGDGTGVEAGDTAIGFRNTPPRAAETRATAAAAGLGGAFIGNTEVMYGGALVETRPPE